MENEFHEWLLTNVAQNAALRVPLGDDAAVVELPPGEQVVVAADAIMDGVHFALAEHGARAAGRKALAVNLSDMAAMAALPLAATLTLTLPRENAAEIAREVLCGAGELAESFGVAICGGDTNCWEAPLSISVTLIGAARVQEVWRRSGGRVGDSLVVTGPLGGSLLGKHLSFQPRVREAIEWRRAFDIHAAIDISDGLTLDTSRLATASQCGAALWLDAIPISTAAEQRARKTGRTPLEHALGDGEDFELLLAMSAEQADRFCQSNPQSRIVGRLIKDLGLWSEAEGSRRELAVSGYEHA